jgi:predicted nucleotidyltransferase component of viral defense system
VTGQLSNIPASIRARLLDGARARGDDFNLVLQRYAAERFLYRLGESRHRERFVLKGAMLFALWGGSFYRATRDLDFAGYGDSDPESFIQTTREICAMSFPGDGIEFDPDSARAEPIRDDTNYGGYRVRLEARLDTANITLQIDVGFGDAIVPPPRYEDYPVLIDMSRPRILSYPPEAVVAEKLHAIVTFGAATSRMKDFYDLFVLSGAPADFGVIGDALRVFLGPPFKALARKSEFRGNWARGGPWA